MPEPPDVGLVAAAVVAADDARHDDATQERVRAALEAYRLASERLRAAAGGPVDGSDIMPAVDGFVAARQELSAAVRAAAASEPVPERGP